MQKEKEIEKKEIEREKGKENEKREKKKEKEKEVLVLMEHDHGAMGIRRVDLPSQYLVSSDRIVKKLKRVRQFLLIAILKIEVIDFLDIKKPSRKCLERG